MRKYSNSEVSTEIGFVNFDSLLFCENQKFAAKGGNRVFL